MGGGGSAGGSTSTSIPTLYNWKSIMTPWSIAGQKEALPTLMERFKSGGLTPREESSLWGSAKQQLEQGSNAAGLGFARQMAASGISPNSPAAAGGWSDIGMNKIRSTAQAAMDFIKTKIGARDTATQQLLTALYTPAPVAVGQTTYSSTVGPTGGK